MFGKYPPRSVGNLVEAWEIVVSTLFSFGIAFVLAFRWDVYIDALGKPPRRRPRFIFLFIGFALLMGVGCLLKLGRDLGFFAHLPP